MKNLSDLQGNEKYQYIHDNFNDIATSYNLFNDLSTFFLHRLWKRKIIKIIEQTKKKNLKAVDLCCGTGDIAVELCKSKSVIEVQAIDFSENMIEVAQNRLSKYQNVTCKLGDATNLISIKSNSYDVVTMGFGLRNVVSIEKALNEVSRILKKNGIFICLDIGKVKLKIIRKLANLYFFKVVPKIGNMLHKNKNGMFKYLPMSSINYPNQKEICIHLEKIGLHNITTEEFAFGNVVLHKGEK